jgi:hypothetical protein
MGATDAALSMHACALHAATLRDFRHCPNLQELYLRKNEVADVAELSFLAPLKALRVLWLSDNPIADHPYYRQLAIRILPGLEKLDSNEVTDQERAQASRNPELERYIVQMNPEGPRPPARTRMAPPPASSPREGGAPPSSGGAGGGGGGGGGGPSGGGSNKNILYAVMALMPELDADDLVLVKREIETRLASLGPGAGISRTGSRQGGGGGYAPEGYY